MTSADKTSRLRGPTRLDTARPVTAVGEGLSPRIAGTGAAPQVTGHQIQVRVVVRSISCDPSARRPPSRLVEITDRTGNWLKATHPPLYPPAYTLQPTPSTSQPVSSRLDRQQQPQLPLIPYRSNSLT